MIVSVVCVVYDILPLRQISKHTADAHSYFFTNFIQRLLYLKHFRLNKNNICRTKNTEKP